MIKEMVVDVSDTGVVAGLHFDEFPLGFLGHMEVGRASEIMWDDTAQSWFVVIPGRRQPTRAATGFEEYSAARMFEVEWLQLCMKEGVKPTDLKGMALTYQARRSVEPTWQ